MLAVRKEDNLWIAKAWFTGDGRGGPAIVKSDRGDHRPAVLPPGTAPMKVQVTRWWSDDRSFGLRITDVVDGPAKGLLAVEFIGHPPTRFWYNESLQSSLRMPSNLREMVQKETNRDCSKW